jgi:hypothetical protein
MRPLRSWIGTLAVLGLAMCAAAADVRAAQTPAAPAADGVSALLHQLEIVVQGADAPAFLALLTAGADRDRALAFASSELLPGATRVVIHERDREPLTGTLPGNGFRLVLDVFAEHGARARIATWRLDVKRTRDANAADGTGAWSVADEDRLNAVESLYKIALDPGRQYDAHNLVVTAEDLELSLTEGSVFVSGTDQGVTGVVLLGRGEMHFHPAPRTEQGQVKIFCGSDTLNARFDTAYLRMNPSDFESFISSSQITERPVDPRSFRRAEDVFREESPKSFALDLGDLSRDPWSLLPAPGDFLAEVHTRRFDSLTYARSAAEAEDITLFDRRHRHNIALYASAQKIARNGRFYDEDDLADYDILDYDIDVSVTPDREWIDGRAQLRLKIRNYGLGALTLHLADSLVVQSIVSDQFGRLFGIRVKNQNALVINLPTMQPRDKILTLTIAYAGRLPPQAADRETIGTFGDPAQRGQTQEEVPTVLPEPSFLYSSRSFWYPQGQVTDYATATMRVNVPAALDCVASGAPLAGSPLLLAAKDPAAARKLYVFRAAQPIRYLALLISRFVQVESVTVAFDQTDAAVNEGALPPMAGPIGHSLDLIIEANPRQAQRGREMSERAVDIAQFYVSLLGDAPYPSFTIALVESDLPGGHSPGYFAALNQPLPTTPFVWRNDPVAFSNFPEFFLAHEIAHQWWGQAVGWRNYHEQWLSEGFAQYFAALYAQHLRGDETFTGILRQLRRWSIDTSDSGPIYLGYRLGHIRGESRTFRALVYDKGAAVLHMLRRLVGDDAFFRGVRRFYRTERFQKAGTEGFRLAMEQEAGRPLDRFFERWIYGSTLPKLRFSYRVEGADVLLHVEQVGETFDVPITVRLEYEGRKPVDVTIPITDRIVERRVALVGTLRGAEISRDDGTLAEIVKG